MDLTPVSAPLFYGKPLMFAEKRHMYFWGGQHIPSVTTIIGRLSKPLLIQWAADCAVEHINRAISTGQIGRVDEWEAVLEAARGAHATIRDDAADLGKLVHRYAQHTLDSTRPAPDEPLDEAGKKAVGAFWQWVEQHRIEPLAVERRVMSEKHLYAGTCDFFGRIDGVLSVLDFKTSKGVYDEAWWQTAGYEYALAEELGNLPVPLARWIVHLNKETGECTAHCRNTIEDWQQDRTVWLSLVKLDQALRAARKHPQPKKKAA